MEQASLKAGELVVHLYQDPEDPEIKGRNGNIQHQLSHCGSPHLLADRQCPKASLLPPRPALTRFSRRTRDMIQEPASLASVARAKLLVSM